MSDETALRLTGQTTRHLTEYLLGQKTFLMSPSIIKDFSALQADATRNGFLLSLTSSFRSFEQQLSIWNRKYNGQRPILDDDNQVRRPQDMTSNEIIHAILRWSALPGASRHHWGTDMDVYCRRSLPSGTNIMLEPWEYFTGHQKEFYQWLQQALPQFGFFFPYAQDLGGVGIEPWHISHQSTATPLLATLTSALLSEVIQNCDICGKAELLDNIDSIYRNYVININTESEA